MTARKCSGRRTPRSRPFCRSPTAARHARDRGGFPRSADTATDAGDAAASITALAPTPPSDPAIRTCTRSSVRIASSVACAHSRDWSRRRGNSAGPLRRARSPPQDSGAQRARVSGCVSSHSRGWTRSGFTSSASAARAATKSRHIAAIGRWQASTTASTPSHASSNASIEYGTPLCFQTAFGFRNTDRTRNDAPVPAAGRQRRPP